MQAVGWIMRRTSLVDWKAGSLLEAAFTCRMEKN